MSVFTSVSDAQATSWLTRYGAGDVGEFEKLTPISTGIENTNYFLTASKGDFVLTLYERLPAEDLPSYLNFTAHLARSGVAVPAPIADRTGAMFSMLNGKPASLIERVVGAVNMTPSATHCAAIGEELACLHNASANFRSKLGNKRGPAWHISTARAVRQFIDEAQNKLISDEIVFQRERHLVQLPTGAIHADLFRDNVLFDDDKIAGVIDFGFAATDEYAYDLAITVNDWCSDAKGVLDIERMQALLCSYTSVRPLTSAEQNAWPSLLRAGALRFWLSRLYDLYLPRAAEINTPHDPEVFERMLRLRIDEPCQWLPSFNSNVPE